MAYPKIFVGQFREKGGLNKIPSQVMDIAILKEAEVRGKMEPMKLSIELKKPGIKGPEGETRSFRTSSVPTIENMISAMCVGLGIFLCERGMFDDPFGKGLDKEELEIKVNDQIKHLINKVREAIWDAVRIYKNEMDKI